MSEIKVNSDLLKCENQYFTEESKTKSLLITKSAKKNAINDQLSKAPFKTEKISSSVLNRAKQFLDFTKTDDNITEKCDLVDENSGENEQKDDKQMIEMNLMLFENKKLSNDESSDEESESNQSSHEDSDDSDDDSSDCEQHSDNEIICVNKDK